MRWAPLHPRQLMALGLLAFAVALAMMLASAPELGTLDFSIGSSSSDVTTAAPAPAPAEPSWVHDPLAPPLSELSAR